LNEEATDLADSLSCPDVFVLHSEPTLQVRETLRVGSGVSPDDSILLRDYLRLFANVVPTELIEPKVGKLIQQAKDKIFEEPDIALKEVEELAESFGHPKVYRELLRFYEVRNITGTPALKRAQRLWEITRDSQDPILWQALSRAFEPKPRWQRGREWSPNLDFVEAVWRDAGKRDRKFGMKLVEAYEGEDRGPRGADVLLEIIKTSEPTAQIVSRCIALLDASNRGAEANMLIQQFKADLASEPDFVETWARHALRGKRPDQLSELTQSPVMHALRRIHPLIAAQVFFGAGLIEEANAIADQALQEVSPGPLTRDDIYQMGEIFHAIGRWEDLERIVAARFSPETLDDLRRRLGVWHRRG
jgi:hypothetical protein